MKPDGTNPAHAADGSHVSPEGTTRVTEQDAASGTEGKECGEAAIDTWSYLFAHSSAVRGIEEQLAADGVTFFIHKSVRHFRKDGVKGVHHKTVPTVSGLIFIKGSPQQLQTYLDSCLPTLHLCRDCATGLTARIPDSQMRPFMQLNATEPQRLRLLQKPISHYARNHTLLRITGGSLAGLEGYIIRIDRDRRLVMDVGGIAVAVSGVHAEHFEPAGGSSATTRST